MFILPFLQSLNPEIAVFLMGMAPIGELRLAIPMALGFYKMTWGQAFFWGVLGNWVIALCLILFLNIFSEYLLKRNKLGAKLLNWLFDRTRRKVEKKYLKYGEIALIFFVALPMPGTGAWTAAVAAFLFGIPKRQSLVFISLGVFIAGVIVTLLSLGVFNFI